MSSPALASRLDILRSTSHFDPAVLQRFAAHLSEAAEEAVFRMSPLRYAQETGLPEAMAVELFLRATHAGLLDFTWGVLCPFCSSFITTSAGLRSLSEQRRCTMCQVDVTLDDEAVEIAFTVSQPVRKLRFREPGAMRFGEDWKTLFFSPSAVPDAALAGQLGGLMRESWVLAPGAEQVIEATLEPGRYAVLAPIDHSWAHFTVSADAPGSELEIHLVDGRLVPESGVVRAGRVRVKVHNRTDKPAALGFMLDPTPAPENRTCGKMPNVVRRPYLTGKRLVTNQIFRELFRSESLPSQDGLEFKSLTLLFTDLKGSTQMYGRIGDFRAFGLVREHFQLLRELVGASGGALVKTIGDAIMASFPEPAPAIEAAARMREQVRKVGGEGALELKLGLHSGPCIAVESNERLDYFGQTVNIAARVQGVAQANEIACTEPVFGAPGVAAAIRAAKLSTTQDHAVLKGVDGEVTFYRLR
ncbi:MAG: DUF5939 domain-containing protein [Myxococcaceae bacterium]